jgi:hypothetical protein
MRAVRPYRSAAALVGAGALVLSATLAGGIAPSPSASAGRPEAALGTVSLPPPAPHLEPRWVVNALYITVVDDDAPPRFTSPQRGDMCGPDTRVFADGHPVSERQPIPGPVFMLRWEIDGCRPLGSAGPLLAGRYEVLVMHDDEHGPGAILLQHDPLFVAPAAALHLAQRR